MKNLALISMCGAALFALAVTATQAQQSPAPTSAPAQPAAAPGAGSASIEHELEGVLEQPISDSEYHYDPQGRRDPFRSLIGATTKIVRENAPPGVAGFLIEELDLQGVIQTKQGLVGMVNGPDNNGYLLRVGDKVFDGEVVRVTPTTIVFRQETREIVKELTPQSERRR